jgi:DNA-binding NarL/FixJ family response regulator
MANDGLIRVLLVDDNRAMIYTIRTILEQYPNIEVVGEAVNGEEAIRRAEQLQPNVVVMDINMPKMDGIAATRLIRANLPRTVVLGLTTNTDRCFVDAMSDAGAFNTLSKENAATELHGAIQSAVASVYPVLIRESTPVPTHPSLSHKRIEIKLAKQVRVLLVDDHAMVRQGLRAALKPYPNIAVIAEAEDGEQAMVSAERLQPDVIVMDIRLSRMDGVTATRLIKARYPHVVIIGITAEAQDFHTDAMKRAGALDVLMKDNAIQQLYAAIQRGVAAVVPVLIQEETPTALQPSDDPDDSPKPASRQPSIQEPDV